MALLNEKMTLLKERFIDQGVPVIVGEYGCYGKNKARETINYYLTTVSKAMYEIGACPIYWCTTGDQYSRYLCEFTDQELLEQLLSPLEK